MIYINHAKKVIFIHIPKTGGSYIGAILVKYYGFVSYVHLCYTKRPDHAECCESGRASGNLIYDNSFFNRSLGVFPYISQSVELSNQMNMDPQRWASYKKICFIRNPFTRFISGWNHMNIIFCRNISLDAYAFLCPYKISDIEYGHVWMNQVDHLGGVAIDYIGRFEYLELDLRHILRSLGFSISHIPRKINCANLSDESYMINKQTSQKLCELFKRDIEFYSTIRHF